MIKRLLLIIVVLLTMVSCKQEDPLRYKGCVLVDIDNSAYPRIKLKLTDSLRTKFDRDYYWIYVPTWEVNRLHIGDTIK